MKFGTLQVYPRQGLLQEHGLDLPSAVIGRSEGSNIHIDDFSVSRRHARLTVEAGRLLVEDLGSVGGTFVDGERLEPGVRHLIEEGAVLRFGEIEAHYLPPVAVEATPAVIDEGTEIVSAGGLSIALVSPEAPIEAGRQATATLVVTNRGRLVDNVRVELPDLPPEWYTVDAPAFPILPGGRADVKISLHPPRRHDALAGDYAYTVAVRSQEYDEHPETQGSFQILPFESAAIAFEAVRSKRNFRILAENRGNEAARYELSGADDEQAFRYEFETPAVELQPGEKRIINLAVRRPRQMFGPPQQPPFTITGKSASGAEITANGQLAVRPPLQKFRMPVMFTLAALVLAVTAMAVLILTDGEGTKTAGAEDPYAGVHLCEDKDALDEQKEKNAEAADDKPLTSATVVGPYDGGRPIFGEVDKNGAPFFAQSDPRWGGDEYARSTELPNGKDWCGTTIEQCGCAMTSVSVMLALYDILQMPGGEPLSPQTLNAWFNGAARQTDRGWVSRGYIYGDVIWSAANELSAEVAKTNPNTRTVRFVRTGSGSEDDIRSELNSGRPVILEVPGHWIAAVGLDEDGTILINDPFYRDRKTLDVYAGKVRSSVHYEPSSDLSSVVITAPADVKFKITDKQGRVVNTGSGTIDQPTDTLNQIPGASVSARHAWRDPTCIESAPPSDAGTNQVVLPGSRDDYVVEILDAGADGASLAIHTYGRDGTSSIATIEGEEGTKAEIAYDPNADKPVINISTNGTPQPATSTPRPSDGGAGGEDETPTPLPSPTGVPTPTSTPFVEQRTAMTLPAEPGQTRVEVATNSGFELGDPIRFAPGLPNEEDNVIVGFGSFILATPLKFAHSPGEPIARLPRPPGQGPGLPPGITPPPSTGPIEPPKEVTMACSTIYQPSPKQATLICDLQVNGDYTTTRWTLNGRVVDEFSGSPSLIMTFPGDAPANISATVCNVTLCRSTSKNEQVLFPATGTGTTGGTGTGGTGTGPGAAPTPTAGQVTVTCVADFPITPDGQVAQFNCEANFSGEFTSISWSAPGGTPANQSGSKKTFTTAVTNTPGSPVSLKVTATVCNFGTCRTSQPTEVGISRTITLLESSPLDAVNQGHKLTLMARVQGLPQPGSKAIPVTPQGGTVQFYADGFPTGQSATLFTVGSVAVAQVAVETVDLSTTPYPDETGLPHAFVAVYSGGTNAFGSASDDGDAEPRLITVKPPLPDGCDSVNNDGNTDADPELEDPVTDGTCNFQVQTADPPGKNLGGGTIINSVTISGAGVEPDSAPNAAIVDPGETFTVSGTAGRTDYCPGCIRQVYLGIGPNATAGTGAIMPINNPSGCVFTGGLPPTPAGVSFGTQFRAPDAPGVYYIRATTTLDYFCVAPPVGPPESSVARIIVRKPVTAAVELWDWPTCAAPTTTAQCTWNPLTAPRTQVSGVEEGDRILLVAKVPQGSTGRVEFATSPGNVLRVGGAVPSARVCPANGQLPIPGGLTVSCTPWEARVVTDPINAIPASSCVTPVLDPDPPICVSATYLDPDPLIVPDPADTTVPYQTNTYDIRFAATPASNTLGLRVLAPARVAVAVSPSPVMMGGVLTLTADVSSANSALNLVATGGTVQFKTGGTAGGRNLGGPVPVNAAGHAEIRWQVGVNPPTSTDCLTGCAGGGFPFDAHDEGSRSTYDDVYAVYTTGGTSPLTSACDPSDGTETDVPESANCPLANVDIDAAPSSSTITAVSVSAPTLGQSFTITATVTSTGFTPVPGVLTFRADGSTLATHTLSAAECPAAGAVYTCTFTTASISTGGDGDVIDSAGTYSLTASFSGTEELDASTSDAFTLAFSLATPALTVTLPGSGTITVGDSGNIRAVVSGSPANRLDDSPARLRFFNGGTQLADLAVTNLGGSVLGADFSVSSLAAGSYSIIVQYVANSYFSGTTSTAQTLTVNQATPTVALNSITPVQVGNNLALSGSVSGSGIQSPAGGSVSFYLGGTSGTLLGTDSDLSNGVSISVPTGDGQTLATAGTAYANIVARFNGDATNGNVAAATSAAQSVTLTKRNSTVTTANVTAEVGQAVTLSASVSSGSANASPDCSACVQFKYGASLTSATDIGPAQDVVSGQATLANVSTGASTPFSANSSYTIWAVYAGNANVNGNNDSATLQLAAQVSVTASAPASGTVNSAVTLQATVSPTSAPGTIQFKVNGTNFGSAQTLSSGSASISWTPSATGSFSITAAYNSSSSNYLDDPDSNTATITVNPIAVSVVVTANASVTLGSSILLTADLSPNAAPGIVRFFADGVEISGTGGVTADTSDGDTTFSWTPTSVGDGTATISATYTSSSANYASQATSTNDNVTINPAATTIVATAAQTGGAGSTITLTASITSSFGNQANIDGGNVTWTITAGAGTCTGLTSATVTDGIATLTGVTCPAGNNYNVRGTYTGSGNYAGSSDTTDYDLDVN